MIRKARFQRHLILAIVALVAGGTLAYSLLEGLSPFDALYLLIITVTTVGYGDLHPVTVGGRLLTLLVVPVGLMLVFGLGVAVVADRLDDLVLRGGAGRLEKRVAALKNHFIVCGYGRLGRGAAAMLRRMGGDVVVVDVDRERFREVPEDMFYVVGDVLQEEVLVRAGIHRARSIVSTFEDDTINVYLVLEALDIRPDIEVITAASGREASRRLYLAGAARVVSPQVLGAEILAKSAYNPSVYQLMSDMISGTTPGETITQVLVRDRSPLAGRLLKDFKSLGVRARVMLIRTATSTQLSPTGDVVIEPGSVLVVIGTGVELEKLEQLASS